jgi:hypothetical protein
MSGTWLSSAGASTIPLGACVSVGSREIRRRSRGLREEHDPEDHRHRSERTTRPAQRAANHA